MREREKKGREEKVRKKTIEKENKTRNLRMERNEKYAQGKQNKIKTTHHNNKEKMDDRETRK